MAPLAFGATPGPSQAPLALGAGPRVERLGFGTWAWGNKLLWGYEQQNDPLLQSAFDCAIAPSSILDKRRYFFDTGDSYGTGELEGRAEELLGKFRRENRRPERAVLGTKLAVYPNRLTGESFERACRASLDRMCIDQIDLVQATRCVQQPGPVRRVRAGGSVKAARVEVDMWSFGGGGVEVEVWGVWRGALVAAGSEWCRWCAEVQISRTLMPNLAQAHWSAANFQPWQEPALWDGLARCYEAGLARACGTSNFGVIPRQLESFQRNDPPATHSTLPTLPRSQSSFAR